MSGFRIVNVYRHAPAKVWRALTDPALVPRWTATGRGGRPVGFAAVVGTRFQYVARPMPGWNGIVQCEVLEVRAPTLLRYAWFDDGGATTVVTNRLAPCEGGTRFEWEHTGFTGVGGFVVARVLGAVRKKMLGVGLPALLDALGDDGPAAHSPAAVRRPAE